MSEYLKYCVLFQDIKKKYYLIEKKIMKKNIVYGPGIFENIIRGV